MFRSGYNYVIGVDEVGMACLAGPVTVCAVQFSPEFFKRVDSRLARLRDSKALLSHQRQNYAAILEVHPHLSFRIVSALPVTIDRINIYQASRLAMRKAIRAVADKGRTMVLVDGNKLVKGLTYEQTAIVKGDRKIFAIACASVLAKVHRDEHMKRQALRYPGYGLEQHKGYPTKLHYERIKVLGPSKLHRRSFRGII